MDIYEAAVEVLRHAGRPLHYKKITELAVTRGLLDPSKGDPSRALRERLDARMAKGGNVGLKRTRPGVFALGSSEDSEGETTVKRPLASARSMRGAPMALQSIAMRARGVLKGHQRQPMSTRQLAEVVMEDAAENDPRPEALLRAALTAANRAQQSAGHRPLFDLTGDGAWGLVEWGLTDAAVEREAELLRIAHDITVQTKEKLTRALRALSREGIEHLVFRLLESLGAHELETSRQEDGAALVTAVRQDALSTSKTVILILSTDRMADLDDLDVLSEALSEMPSASGLIIAPLGLDDDTANAITIDGRIRHHNAAALAGLLVHHRIGVQIHHVPILLADAALLRDLS